MKTYIITFTFLMSFLMISAPSFALGKLGHQLVCQMAFEHLPSSQQEKLQKLLTAIPENHQDLINHYNYKKQGSPITFANACTWADAIKRVEKFKRYASWHYMNVPRNQANIKPNACKENCLPQGILQHQNQLKHNKPSWEKTQALLFIGHWLGDIHQPLHISFASDLGGNKVKLSHLGTKCSNLHWYWDDCILYKGKNSKRQWSEILTTQWDDISIPTWQPDQVWQWANESYQIAITPSFNYCQMDSKNNCQQPTEKVKLPENYLVDNQSIMEQRLLLAAKRLTNILAASL